MKWNYAGDFRDGVAVIQNEEGQSSHIDIQGNLLHSKWYLDLDVFHKGFARAKDNDGWTHINKYGKPINNLRFSMIEAFYNGQARCEKFDGSLVIINEAGTELLKLS